MTERHHGDQGRQAPHRRAQGLSRLRHGGDRRRRRDGQDPPRGLAPDPRDARGKSSSSVLDPDEPDKPQPLTPGRGRAEDASAGRPASTPRKGRGHDRLRGGRDACASARAPSRTSRAPSRSSNPRRAWSRFRSWSSAARPTPIDFECWKVEKVETPDRLSHGEGSQGQDQAAVPAWAGHAGAAGRSRAGSARRQHWSVRQAVQRQDARRRWA